MNPEAFSADEEAQITQLQQQQALFTQALRAMLEGRWTGDSSVEAYLYALDPNMQGTLALDTPVTESEWEEEGPKA
jgi:hypothetical protein